MLEDREPYGNISRKTNNKQGTKEVVDTFDSRFYYKTISSSWKRCNFSSL